MQRHIVRVLKEIRSRLTPETLNDIFRNLAYHADVKKQDRPEPARPEEGFTAFEEHNYYEMTVQIDKHTLVQIGSAYYDLVPGQFCIIPPGVSHRIKWGSSTDPTANMMWISITPEIVRTSYTIYSKNTRSKIWGSDLNIPGNFLISEVFAERQKDREDSPEAIVCYIQAFLTMILQNLNFQNETSGLGWTSAMVSEVQEYIKAHLGSPLSLNDLSAHVSLSPNYLCKVFKQVTGDTITHYTQNLKIEKSIEMLRDDSLSVGEIAERLSFCDQFYFSKVFKSYVSVSPQQYRKSLRMQQQAEDLL